MKNLELEKIPTLLGVEAAFSTEGGVHWLDPAPLTVRQVAEAMNSIHARFITITAYQLPKDEGLKLEYHWDLGGRLLGFTFKLEGNQVESIFDLCEAVDWVEREVHEGWAVEFTGREYVPLLLRPGDPPGVNLREAEQLRSPFAPAAEPAPQPAAEEVKP